MANRLLSLIMPVWNEEKTLHIIIEQLNDLALPFGLKKEIIIINDGSKDNTLEVAKKLAQKYPDITVHDNGKNLGKSATVRRGMLLSKGDYVVVQDADTEYDPKDLISMLELAEKEQADVVYGNRFGQKNQQRYLSFYMGNRVLSFISNLFTFPRLGVWIPDMEVCYKLMRGEVSRDIATQLVTTSRFGIEPEITARIARYKNRGSRLKVLVTPIKYMPRSIEDGKKIRWMHGVEAMYEIVKFNLIG